MENFLVAKETRPAFHNDSNSNSKEEAAAEAHSRKQLQDLEVGDLLIGTGKDKSFSSPFRKGLEKSIDFSNPFLFIRKEEHSVVLFCSGTNKEIRFAKSYLLFLFQSEQIKVQKGVQRK